MSRGLCLLAVLSFCTFHPPECFSDAPSDALVETFSIPGDGDGLLLPAFAGGAQFFFLLDTGCSCNIIDTSLTHGRNLTGTTIEIEGNTIPLFSTRDIVIGDSQTTAGAKMAAIDLTEFRRVLGRDFHGVLGLPFLKKYVVKIDFDGGTLSLLGALRNPQGERLAMSYARHGLPVINIALDHATTMEFVIDSGMVGIGHSLSVREQTYEYLLKRRRIDTHPLPARMLTAHGNETARRGRLKQFRIADFAHKQVVISEGREHTIGLGMLSRYLVTLDFPNNQVYLKAGKRFSDPDVFDLSGLSISRDGDNVTVSNVEPGRPGDAAGIKEGDLILTVNGTQVSKVRLFQIRTILATDHTEVRLAVARSRGRREVVLQLQGPSSQPCE